MRANIALENLVGNKQTSTWERVVPGRLATAALVKFHSRPLSPCLRGLNRSHPHTQVECACTGGNDRPWTPSLSYFGRWSRKNPKLVTIQSLFTSWAQLTGSHVLHLRNSLFYKKYPPVTYYWTVPLILDHSYLVGEINKFENCWYKSVTISEVLKLLFQQFWICQVPNEIWVVQN